MNDHNLYRKFDDYILTDLKRTTAHFCFVEVLNKNADPAIQWSFEMVWLRYDDLGLRVRLLRFCKGEEAPRGGDPGSVWRIFSRVHFRKNVISKLGFGRARRRK